MPPCLHPWSLAMHPSSWFLFRQHIFLKRDLACAAVADKPAGQCYNGGFAPDAGRNVSGWLAGYAPGVSDGPLPYPNTLAAATEYCCRADVAPGCGGVTLATNTNWSFGRYEARAPGALNPLPPDSSIRTWLKRTGGVATPFFVSNWRQFRVDIVWHSVSRIQFLSSKSLILHCAGFVAERDTEPDIQPSARALT